MDIYISCDKRISLMYWFLKGLDELFLNMLKYVGYLIFAILALSINRAKRLESYNMPRVCTSLSLFYKKGRFVFLKSLRSNNSYIR